MNNTDLIKNYLKDKTTARIDVFLDIHEEEMRVTTIDLWVDLDIIFGNIDLDNRGLSFEAIKGCFIDEST